MFFRKKYMKIICLAFILIMFIFNNLHVFADDLENDIDNSSKTAIDIQAVSTDIKDSKLDLNSRSCVVIDRLSQTILYGKNEKKKVKMASTTKIMTAIVVLENYTTNKTIEVSKKAANTGGSRLGLKTGDKISILDLLYGLLLCSGNDAAVALAETVGGSIEGFSELMNKKANEVGLSNTHFESPHGLDSDGHYTTAYELAILSNYALENATFKNIVGTKNYTVTINGYPKALSNTNELLGNLNGVYGIKTGFTNGANRCLVTACKRGNLDIICVVLGADTKNFRTKDSIKLIEYCFKNYEYYNVKEFANKYLEEWKNTHHNFFSIKKGISNDLEIKIESSIDKNPVLPIRKDLISTIKAKATMMSQMPAPVNKNELVGKLKITSENDIIAEFDLVSNTNIRKNNIFDYMLEFFKNYSDRLENFLKTKET